MGEILGVMTSAASQIERYRRDVGDKGDDRRDAATAVTEQRLFLPDLPEKVGSVIIE